MDKDWRPEFGEIITWFAADKNDCIAMMVNNCWGELPPVVKGMLDADQVLDEVFGFFHEGLNDCEGYYRKKGGVVVDMYSACMYRSYNDEGAVLAEIILSEKQSRIVESNLPSRKGLFVFQALESHSGVKDYPVGFDGNAEDGDYFRNLLPTDPVNLNELPDAIKQLIVKSDIIDFQVDRLITTDDVLSKFVRFLE